MTLMDYYFTQKVNKTELFNAIAELLQLDNSQIMCTDTGIQTENTKAVAMYSEFGNGDYKATVEINSYETIYDQTQFYELDFGIKLAKKIKADLYASAPDSSPYDLIKITPNGSVYNCIDDFYKDEEITKIVNLGKFSDEGIIKLKKEYTKAAIKEHKEYNNRDKDYFYKQIV